MGIVLKLVSVCSSHISHGIWPHAQCTLMSAPHDLDWHCSALPPRKSYNIIFTKSPQACSASAKRLKRGRRERGRAMPLALIVLSETLSRQFVWGKGLTSGPPSSCVWYLVQGTTWHTLPIFKTFFAIGLRVPEGQTQSSPSCFLHSILSGGLMRLEMYASPWRTVVLQVEGQERMLPFFFHFALNRISAKVV